MNEDDGRIDLALIAIGALLGDMPARRRARALTRIAEATAEKPPARAAMDEVIGSWLDSAV